MWNIKSLGLKPYSLILEKMKEFTASRDENTFDELWLLEHPPVYTQGQAGKAEHVLNSSHIPIIQSDRGGQVTYHGPGQLIGYVLMDIQRGQLGIKSFVSQLEQILINLLANFRIKATTIPGAPGVYVESKKIASIGLRIKNGCTYHGIALNVAMDLMPFKSINPCGFAQLEMTQMSHFVADIDMAEVSKQFIAIFLQLLGEV